MKLIHEDDLDQIDFLITFVIRIIATLFFLLIALIINL